MKNEIKIGMSCRVTVEVFGEDRGAVYRKEYRGRIEDVIIPDDEEDAFFVRVEGCDRLVPIEEDAPAGAPSGKKESER